MPSRFIAVLTSLVICVGCSSPRSASPSSGNSAVVKPNPVTPPARVQSKPQRPVPFQPVSQNPEQAAPPSSPQTLSLPQLTASEIFGKYEFAIPSNDTLLVRRIDTAAPPASLYEEAIALAKLRRQLNQFNDLTPQTRSGANLKDGTATIPFGRTIRPDLAADAITSALSVDGIQRVKAVF